ncbi:MAG: hypothetical protein K2X00_00830 [Nitrospiraceae bacterium]|nr:hypothetical protein [Nitrospiraceae bacterium]
MKVYLLTFNYDLAPRQTVLDYLDTRREVLNWYAFLQGSVFLVSRSSIIDMETLFAIRFPNVFFVIIEVSAGKCGGWLPKQTWEFVNQPKSSGRWE